MKIKSRLIAANTHGEMQMIDLNMTTDKSDQCKSIKTYKGFQGTVKSVQIIKKPGVSASSSLFIATCGLDRYIRVHNVETSLLVSKVYLKSRLNCLLYSMNEPIKPPSTGSKHEGKKLEDDELSNVNSEDLGTDDLWSDIETIHEEYPTLKRKLNDDKTSSRLKDFESSETEIENGFKKPK